MRELLNEFKKFIMRGNVLDLAVAVVVGAAFKSVVDSFVGNVIMPIVAAIGGKPNFNDLFFTIHKSEFRYGAFITDVVSFVIIAAAVFVVVKVFETLQNLRGRGGPEAEPLTRGEELLTEIRDLLREGRL